MKRTPLQRKTPLTSGGPRRRRCPSCRVMFTPVRDSQAVCGEIECAVAHGKSEKGQATTRKALADVERRKIKVRKEKLKTRADHLRETQVVFNEWIRLRDAALPCVSCGRYHNGQWHAGHYRTVGGNPELRFEPLNVWRQCAPCNNHQSGNIVNYRIELVKRIGADKLDWLEGPHEPKRYTIEQLKTIKSECRALIKELKGAA
ncbi:recombination protein NinG [Pseudomonas sp. 10S4]|uniref:recombination protein NinG n=1 Tax=Pseudomonas sp. 10S4 TaxID=3048583 RepID=UPI002B230561|nr:MULTISPECIES: recombination protein NinG [unclassified Pseudomonas]MEB0226275.1 recombination protein NinG [Pseudomonas sp. 5S1]MEB0294904.1 recombination protein NinG [Pseudomonas sp. 10S4]